MYRFISFLLIYFIVSTSGVVSATPLNPSRILKVNVGNEYIDSHFSISTDGKYLAYIAVKISGQTELHISNFKNSKQAITNITKITDSPVEVKFLSDKNLLFIKVPTKNKFNYYVFNTNAKQIATFKSLTDLTLTSYNNKTYISTYILKKTTSSILHKVSLYDINNLKKPFKKAQLYTDVRGRIAKPTTMDLVFLTDGYTKAVVKIVGKYDKATDSKLPDKEGYYNILEKKLTTIKAISNNALWEKTASLFAKHQGYPYFLHLTGIPSINGIKGGDFKAGYSIKKWLKIKYDFQIGRFDFASLSQQKEIVGNSLYFTMSVDPQNPITLKKQKSEPANIHIFKLNIKTGQAKEVAEISAKYKVFSWAIGNNKIAIMKLHPNWTIGNTIIMIYSIK